MSDNERDSDQKFLLWIYKRLKYVYKENPNTARMSQYEYNK